MGFRASPISGVNIVRAPALPWRAGTVRRLLDSNSLNEARCAPGVSAGEWITKPFIIGNGGRMAGQEGAA